MSDEPLERQRIASARRHGGPRCRRRDLARRSPMQSSPSSTRPATGSSPGCSRWSPSSLLGFVGWQVWGRLLHWSDLVVFGAHLHPDRASGSRSASTASSPTAASRPSPRCAAVLGVLGSAAIEGPVISWVADHRKHHAFSDQEGDPHSPHVGHGEGGLGASSRASSTPTSAGSSSTPSAATRSASRPTCSRTRWSASSTAPSCSGRWSACAIPFGLGVAIGGTVARRAHRPALGRRGADLRPAPRHLQHQLALPHLRQARLRDRPTSRATSPGSRSRRFGEAWHNNHHAFPTSAVHGHERAAGRPLGGGDLDAREARPRLGRRPDRARAPGRQGRRLSRRIGSAPCVSAPRHWVLAWPGGSSSSVASAAMLGFCCRMRRGEQQRVEGRPGRRRGLRRRAVLGQRRCLEADRLRPAAAGRLGGALQADERRDRPGDGAQGLAGRPEHPGRLPGLRRLDRLDRRVGRGHLQARTPRPTPRTPT